MKGGSSLPNEGILMEIDAASMRRTGRLLETRGAFPRTSTSAHRVKLSVALGNVLVFMGDVCGIALAVFAASQMCRAVIGTAADAWPMLALYIIAPLFAGIYSKRRPYWHETKVIVKAVAQVFLVSAVVTSLLGAPVTFLMLVTLTFVLVSFILPLSHHGFKCIALRMGLWWKPVLIFGGGRTTELIHEVVARDRSTGYRPYLVDSAGDGFRRLDAVIDETGARDLFVANAEVEGRSLLELVNRLKNRNVNVTVIPAMALTPFVNVAKDSLFEDGRSLVFRRNSLPTAWGGFLKRAFDLAAGTAIMVCLLPIMAAVALAVKLDSRGPILFGHERIGRGGKTFRCWKFRSMAANAQELLDELLARDPSAQEVWKREFKLRDDPRVTRVGRFLRKTSLDELPQIFNVMSGEMSLVGPRPIVDDEVEKYGRRFECLKMARPGMTGLWQVSGRSDTSYDERVHLDELFVQDWSMWKDVVILLRTVRAVLARKGAC
jgi:undecaprenyl-phosphate galactose phosphotransferase